MKTIVLAGGKGIRMNSDIPKVLTPFMDSTLIEFALDQVQKADIDSKPLVVVGYRADDLKHRLRKRSLDFVHQKEQLGTGHAVKVCEKFIESSLPIMVLYGDHAMIQPETLKRLAQTFQGNSCKIAMVTYRVPDFDIYQGMFQSYGRILRDEDENMYAIREAKDASIDELNVREINPGYYMFDGPWLWKNLTQLSAGNSQNEYYLTDLVEMAIEQGELVETILGHDLVEAIGVNTPEHLAMAEKLYAKRI